LGAESAKASDISLQNLQNILNRGNFKPGKFAVAQSEIASIATGLGIGGERAKLMSTDSALTVQAVSDITASRIKEMGSAISNADVTFSAGRGPQISNQEEAMQFYIDLNGVVNKRKKDYFNYVAKNPVPDVAEKWSQTSQGTSSIYEDPKLRKYLPKFPVKQGPDKGKTAYQLPTGDIVLFD
jgi:osmotically-inducible protein OsmY